MIVDFETEKHKKLNRLVGLKIMNQLGMVAWKQCEHELAKQHLRLMHPLSWLWFSLLCFYGVLAQGIPVTVKDLVYSMKHDTVWW